jgi:hypothetical protein
MSVFVTLFLVLMFSGTTPDYEQIATEHFFRNTINLKYPDLKVVEFANKTDVSVSAWVVSSCEQWDKETRTKIRNKQPEEPNTLSIPESPLQVKKIRKRSNRLKVEVSPRRKVGENYYVVIRAYKRLYFVDHFLYEFDSQGRLLNTCTASEII